MIVEIKVALEHVAEVALEQVAEVAPEEAQLLCPLHCYISAGTRLPPR